MDFWKIESGHAASGFNIFLFPLRERPLILLLKIFASIFNKESRGIFFADQVFPNF